MAGRATLLSLIEEARRAGRALAHLECWNLESLEAIVGAANRLGRPVITGPGLSFADPQWAGAGAFAPLLAACRCAADRSTTPVAVVLNEAQQLEEVRRGLEGGADLVMLSTGDLPLEDNLARTCAVVALAREYGAAVEGELGGPAAGAPGRRQRDEATDLTDPDQARRFVATTGVDFLAVSVGNVHTHLGGQPAIQLELVRQLAEAAQVPLVLHGGSGIPPDLIPALIAAGVAKINVGAALRSRFWGAIRRIARQPGAHRSYIWLGRMAPPDPLAEARLALESEVERWLRLISGERVAGPPSPRRRADSAQPGGGQ